MGPGRKYEKNAAGFVIFFIFIVVVALASACQRSSRADEGRVVEQIEVMLR